MTLQEHTTVLRLLLADKDSFTITRGDAQTIGLKSSALIHIQTKDIETEKDLPQLRVWNRNAWEMLWSTWKRKKQNSELGRQRLEIVNSQLNRIADGIVKYHGGYFTKDVAVQFAIVIWQGKQEIICTQYGIDTSGIVWPDEMDQHLQKMIPLLKAENIL